MGKPIHEHSEKHNTTNIRVAFFLNLGFTIVEIIGGLLTNSMAILSDALHDLGDSVSLGTAWYFQKLSQKDRDAKYSYGYGRFSILGAVINSIVLIVGSVFIVTNSIPRLLNPIQPETNGMILLSILGIVVNGLAVIRLKKGTSLNERVISLHLLEDVLGWIVVLIASVVMHFYELPWLDALLSLFIAAYILFNVYSNLKQAFKIILQATPENIDIARIENKVATISELIDVHDCHVWSLDGEYNVLTIDVVADPSMTISEQEEIKTKIYNVLKDEEIHHFTIMFESPDVLKSDLP